MIELYKAQEIIEAGMPLFLTLLPVVGMALSGRQKALALMGPRYRKCQWNYDNSQHCGKLEFSHDNHSREDVNGVSYDDFRRCHRYCLFHHLKYHQIFPADQIGLTEQQNEWSIDQIQTRLNSYLYLAGRSLG